MSDQIVYLHPSKRTPLVATPATPGVIVGRQYLLNSGALEPEIHGICSGQVYNRQHGRTIPFMGKLCYIWDVDDELISEEPLLSTAEGETITLTSANNVLTSHFVLSHSAISEPQIIQQESSSQLMTSASFDFVFNTRLPVVHLGLLSLVETDCFAQLSNGERYTLRKCDEGQPVLYQPETDGPDDVITPMLEIKEGGECQQHNYSINLSQAIPDRLAGSEVETLTVLEQYTSYFIQREIPFSEKNIWTPVCPPLTWGWSMRVGKRHDGDWCIVRQKLLMPTVGHNGLEMPAWEGYQKRE